MFAQLCQRISELPTFPNQLKLQVELDSVFNEPRKQVVIPHLHAMRSEGIPMTPDPSPHHTIKRVSSGFN
jgi:hypothetical protein